VILFGFGIAGYFFSPRPEPKPIPEAPTATWAKEADFGTTQTNADKVQEAKRRLTLRSVIRKGDYYSIKNDKEAALRYYESAYEKTGQKDHVIEKKMADVYFELKKWEDAYNFYKKLPYKELDTETKNRLFIAFISNTAMTDRQKELDKMPEDSAVKAYYSVIGNCTLGISSCLEAIDGYSGDAPQIKELRDAIASAKNLSDDTEYRNSLLAATLYKQKAYYPAAKISEEILAKRPNYEVVLKTAGLSQFELGNYEKAAAFFKTYYAVEPKDVQVCYVLGIIFYYLEDYSTSNLYFNAAVINGYRPKTELERRLVYNYYLLGDKRSTFKIFRYLLEEADVTEEDFEIAIFTAIEEKEYGKATLWANTGIEKWPENDALIAMRGWAALLRDEEEWAIRDFTLALEKNRKNPIALLEFGILYSKKNDYTTAKSYLQAAADADTSGTFGEEARKTLDEIAAKAVVASGSTLSWSESIQNPTP